MVDVSQTVKKIVTQVRQRRDGLHVMFQGWSKLVSEKQEFKAEWDEYVSETRKVRPQFSSLNLLVQC